MPTSNDHPNVTTRFLDNYLKYSTQLYSNLSRNSCAYNVIFQMMRMSPILKYIPVWKSDLPNIVPVLRSKLRCQEEPSLKKAIDELKKISLNIFNIKLSHDGIHEDPWIVLWILKQSLNSFNKEHTLMPVYQYNCQYCQLNVNMKSSYRQYGDLEYLKQRNKVQILSKNCNMCNNKYTIKIVYLPCEFHIRIANCQRFNTFEEPTDPQFENYRINNYIQYNAQLKHFRNIKIVSGKVILMDNGNIETLPIGKLKQILQEDKWANYIISYIRKDDQDEITKKDGTIPAKIPLRITTGGSTNGQQIYSNNGDHPGYNNNEIDKLNIQRIKQKLRHNIRQGQIEKYKQQIRVKYYIDEYIIPRINALEDENSNFKFIIRFLLQKIQELEYQTKIYKEPPKIRPDTSKRQQNLGCSPSKLINQSKQIYIPEQTVLDCLNKKGNTKSNERKSNRSQILQLSPRKCHTDLKYQNQPRQNKQKKQQTYEIPNQCDGRQKQLETTPPRTCEYTQPITQVVHDDNKYDNVIHKLTQNKEALITLNRQQAKLLDNTIKFSPWSSISQLKNKYGESAQDQRSKALSGIPKKSCSFVSAIDIFTRNYWLNSLPYDQNQQDRALQLKKILSGKHGQFRLAIQQIESFCERNRIEIKIGQQEDTWIIISVIIEMLNPSGPDNCKRNMLPIICCPCGKFNLSSSMEYERIKPGRQLNLMNLQCPTCKGNARPKVILPGNIFVRLWDRSILNEFNKTPIPKIQGYYPNAYIQYSKKLNHFRTVKNLNKETTLIMDNLDVRKVKGDYKIRNEIMNEQDWITYIVSYSNPNYSDSTKEPENILKMHINNTRRYILAGSSPEDKLTVTHSNVNSWRTQSLRKRKVICNSSINPDFISLNQSRIQPKGFKGYDCFNAQPQIQSNNIPKYNASLLIKQKFKSKIWDKKINWICTKVQLNKDLWLLASIYIHPTSKSDQELTSATQQLQDSILKFEEQHDQYHLIICGDFNLTYQQIKKKQHIPFFNRLVNLRKSDLGPTSKRGRLDIDHIFSSISPVNSYKDDFFINNNLSDHSIISYQFDNDNLNQRICYQIPNPKFHQKILQLLMNNPHQPFLSLRQQVEQSGIPRCNVVLNAKEHNQINRKQLQNPQFQKIWLAKYDQFIKQQIINKRFSSMAKDAFKKLKNITQYTNYDKKEGSIVSKAQLNGKIINGNDLSRALINHLKSINDGLSSVDFMPFPLVTLSDREIINACRFVKKGKAYTFDGVSSQLFNINNRNVNQKNIKINIIRQFIDGRYWEQKQSDVHLEARLVPLNKAHPNIPKIHQFRAIVVNSPLLKFFEGIIQPYLLDYQKKLMSNRQFGFRNGADTEICKLEVMKLIHAELDNKKSKAINSWKDHTYAFFVDFRNAYDRVPRNKLYSILEKKCILPQNLLHLLQFLHKNTKICHGKYSLYSSRGVPQGFLSSPILFDIFVEDLLDELTSNNLNAIFYADDLVVINKDIRQVINTAEIIEDWAKQNQMIINKNKCGIMPITKGRRKLKLQNIPQEIDNYPIIRSYKYLGITLSNKLSVNSHLGSLKRRFNYINNKLYSLRKIKHDKFNINVFRLLIQPHFRLLYSIFPYLSEKEKAQIQKQKRKMLKKFCLLSLSTPNKLISKINGDFMEQVRKGKQLLQQKLDCFKNKERLTWEYVTSFKVSKNIKIMPAKFIKISNLMSTNKCKSHNCLINENHIKTMHNLQKINRYKLIDQINLDGHLKDKPRIQKLNNCLKSYIRILRKQIG